jgi:hypothetical protein
MIIRSFILGARCLSWIVIAIVVMAALLRADDAATKPEADEGKAEEQRRTAYVRAMQTVATGLKVVRLTDDGETECKVVEDSILNWSDSARHPDLIVPGTTWIWHHKGRPVFIGEIYGRKDSVGAWILFACNLSPNQLRFSDERLKTTLTKSYYDPKEISDSPVVAKTKSERTFQMRHLAERFDAHQFWEERFELRLLPKPIYRYEDADGRLVDGAVYALVHGTNPEVLLLIEAHAADDGSARWKVGFGTLAGARCVVRLDGKEYWTCPKHTGDPADPRQGLTKFVPVADLESSPDGPQSSK